jgi:hypothetical protein
MKKGNVYRLINLFRIFMIIASSGVLNSCTKMNNPFPADKTFNITMNAMNVVPKVVGRIETGTAVLTLHADNTLEWAIQVKDLSGPDALTTAHINLGDPATRGDQLIRVCL